MSGENAEKELDNFLIGEDNREQIEEILNNLIEKGLFNKKNIDITKLIRERLNTEVSKEVKIGIEVVMKEFSKTINKKIDNRINLAVDNQLIEHDLSSRISDEIRDQLKNQFKPIMQEALKVSMGGINKQIQQTLKNVINLKTSSINEVKDNVNNFVDDEKTSVDKLKQIDYEGDERYVKWFEEAERHKYMIKNKPLIPYEIIGERDDI